MPEPDLHDDFVDFIKSLNARKVEFLVVGGFASTDVLSGDFIQIGVVPVRIDVTAAFDGVPQERLWLEAVAGTLGGQG